jgi:hypothetical protein
MPPLALWPDRNEWPDPNGVPKTRMMYIGTSTLPNLTTFRFPLSSKIRSYVLFLLKKKTNAAGSFSLTLTRQSRPQRRSPVSASEVAWFQGGFT